MKINVKIHVLSPIHLGSGQANVNIDAEVAHETVGLPYFPAKRFKGLLHESALEVTEMQKRCGLKDNYFDEFLRLFNNGDKSNNYLIFDDLHVFPDGEYKKISEQLKILEKKYASVVTPNDILSEFTSIRYQTQIVEGVAADTTLHNMRVVNSGVIFYGSIESVEELTSTSLKLLAMAFGNLRRAGAKRNRGFGCIKCEFSLEDGRTSQDILSAIMEKINL